jgi:hypothetical protein
MLDATQAMAQVALGWVFLLENDLTSSNAGNWWVARARRSRISRMLKKEILFSLLGSFCSAKIAAVSDAPGFVATLPSIPVVKVDPTPKKINPALPLNHFQKTRITYRPGNMDALGS